jgi:hypothetical protein
MHIILWIFSKAVTNLIFISFELYRLQDDPPVGVSGAPTDNNILLWNAVIFG